MTPFDAAALGLLGARDRRLMAALIRHLGGRSTAEDLDALPPRVPDETILDWGCRARSSRADSSGGVDERNRILREAEVQLASAARLGVSPLPLFDTRYPSSLATIPDPPPMLWTRGGLDAFGSPGIAIVGSRAATPYGLAMARQIAGDLARAGAVIVSGLARGIDSAAHVAALAVGGRTIGVLGCGIDRIYPAEHRDLARDMEQTGAVVSEFPPGVPPLPYHFPLRNRIISGLSVAVVVVEAPEKSGALITASAALDQGREVMVVPGSAAGARNRGGHLLIRDGAKVVESADDILQDLPGVGYLLETSARMPVDWPDGPDFTVDEVALRTGERAEAILARLLDLELAGKIQRIEGGRFLRVLP